LKGVAKSNVNTTIGIYIHAWVSGANVRWKAREQGMGGRRRDGYMGGWREDKGKDELDGTCVYVSRDLIRTHSHTIAAELALFIGDRLHARAILWISNL